MSLEADARAVAGRAETLKGKRDRIVQQVVARERAIVEAYRAVFLRDGELSPEAMIVLNDLSRFGRLSRDLSLGEDIALRRQATVRATIQHVLGRFNLSPRLIARLVKQIGGAMAPSEIHKLQNGDEA